MKYTKFTIENYKGIEKLELDLDIKPDSKIYTLIGLNESGKTTILEAINDYDKEVAEKDRYLLIPKNKAAGFSDDVLITAEIEINAEDKADIQDILKEEFGYRKVTVPDKLVKTRKYTFRNSVPESTSVDYFFSVNVAKTEKAKKLHPLEATEKEKLIGEIQVKLLPEILFYKDFLTRFPEKIYLEETDKKNTEFISIIDDILKSLDTSYSVNDNLLDRLIDGQDPAKSNALRAITNQMGEKVTKVVFDAWTKVQDVSKKEIIVTTDTDRINEPATPEKKHYLAMRVKDGGQSYSISERSLGFKWFFTFILYTEFRKQRINTKGEILFLLDEPASNLHQGAQKSLLETFSTLTNTARLVYTTHSHHLIDPKWLDGAYIIKNKGLNYKDDDGFNSSKTEIEAYKYKQFVATYPKETSYFQPILDVLEYQPGLLEKVPNMIITEGKFDFYTFRYFLEIVFEEKKADLKFYPGTSASNLDLPIGLYESWGKKYLVLLDSDRKGKEEQKRYIKLYSVPERIFTLENINGKHKNISTEDLFTANEKLEITKEFNQKATSYKKSEFNTGLQTLYLAGQVPDYLEDATKVKFKEILDFLKSKL